MTERITDRVEPGGSDPQDRAFPAGRATTEDPTPSPEPPARSSDRAERVFRALTSGSGLVVVVSIGLIGLFLLIQAVPSLLANQENFFTFPEYITGDADNLRFGIRDLFIVTALSSLFALLLAMPVGLGIALFLTQYAPKRVARPFAYVIDLLAAVPSIVYGLWGALVLAPVLLPLAQWLLENLGWFPLFAQGNLQPAVLTGSIFTAGIVLAVMILPILTAVTREVFSQTPQFHIEAAQALGATRWEVIRTAVLPYGRSGYIAGSMLGLGRALGETIAVLIILRPAADALSFTLFDGDYTFAARIAAAAAEFSQPLPTGAYIAAGLVLFVLTFIVNALARVIAGGKVNG